MTGARRLRAVEAVPALTILALTATLSVNSPWQDEWDLVPYIERMRAGSLEIGDLWTQHNEHRPAIWRAIVLALATVTRWNLRVEAIIGVAVAVGMYVVLRVLITRSTGDAARRPWLIPTAAVLVFTTVQWENWLWGIQLAWFLVALGLVAAVLCLSLPGRRAFAAAVAAALVASLSALQGLFVWPVGLVILAGRRERARAVVWTAAGAAAWTLYFRGHRSQGLAPDLGAATVVRGGLYVLRYLGSPLTPPLPLSRAERLGSLQGPYSLAVAVWAPIAGAVLLLLFGCALWVVVRRHETGEWLPWLGLGGFAVTTAFATVVGRLPFGVAQASSSRYTTMSLMLVLATLVLLVMAHETRVAPWTNRSWLVAAAGVVFAGALLVSYAGGAVAMFKRHDRLAAGAKCVAAARGPSDACLADVYPSPETTWARIVYLRRIGWGGFRPGALTGAY